MLPTTIGKSPSSPHRQRGVATLLIALSILVILTIIILASSNVALFEQKTANNENREMLATQAGEYALNLGGEYLKANVVNIASNEDDDGWLFPSGTNLHWQSCAGITDPTHPCLAERDPTTRGQLYYYTDNGTAYTTLAAAGTHLDLPIAALVPSATQLTNMGGNAKFPATATVRALLCRLDTTPGTTPSCLKVPTTGNRIAVTLVASSNLTNENAAAVVKESWGTYNNFSAVAAMPLVASGIVKGLGNASIVAAPNAGGYGLPGSIWSPNSVDTDKFPGGGLGSVSTCHLGDYLGSVPAADLETTCAGNGNTGCGCSNVAVGSPDMLSGHFGGSTYQESLDILDVDANHGALPDITFFPGLHTHNTAIAGDPATACMDDPAVNNDDNLFEWIFSQDVNGASTCATAADVTKENTVLDDLGATVLADCSSLDSTSSGLYRITGACSLGSDIGSPDNPVVLVTNGDAKVAGNFNFYGMLFINDIGAGASLKGVGNVNVFGSVVVDGDVDLAGGFNIVYVDNSSGHPGGKLAKTTRFARLPGSWLDSNNGF